MRAGDIVFNEGDLVQLKSGGPVMVVRFAVEHLLLCAWSDSSDRVRRATFDPHELRLLHGTSLLSVRVLERLGGKWPYVAVVRP